MAIVTLVSGGLDSSLIGLLASEEGVEQYPLFIDYGQLAANQEWLACLRIHKRFGLPIPARMNISGFGRVIPCGLTDNSLRANEDAFLPGRNLLFLVAGASYCYSKKASAVAIGLLNEAYRIFPDQSSNFVEHSERVIQTALGHRIRILTPLMAFSKIDVVSMAGNRGITGTYSCHAGFEKPCGTCISCREIDAAMKGES